MKKIVSIAMALVLMCSVFVGCAKQEDYKCDIVLITNGDTIKDGGYNQSAWDGISSFAQENDMRCHYYQPALEDGRLTTQSVERYVSLSADNGAQFIVFPGKDFATITFELANQYPDINFILVDAMPHSADDNTTSFMSNVMSITFDTLQSGFLAGYLAVLGGNTDLGFFGEASSSESASYGAGFVQGAGYAADELGVPVKLSWADYDSGLVDYVYDFTVTACYEKIEDADEEVFNVNVVNGIGTGVYTEGSNVTITADPAPVGQVFDHWDIKSDTDGVKDKNVNVSSKTKSTMNLLVEKCDCTIEAVYKDIDEDYNVITVMEADGKTVHATYNAVSGKGASVKAPVATEGLVFDKWETSADLGDTDLTCAEIWVPVEDSDITLIPTYTVPDKPSFNVTVVTGEGGNGESVGSGSYQAGDRVELSAAVPADGYMFSHWENKDYYGASTGIKMDNEYYWSTSFEMVDRYAAICETMFDNGADAIFDGGNSSNSAYNAKASFDFDVNVISAGAKNKKAYSTILKNYGEAVKLALADFKGGGIIAGNCANNCINATFVCGDDELDKQAKYDAVYAALANGNIKMASVQGGAGYDYCKLYNEQTPFKCLTLDAWFLQGVSLV